MVDKPSLKELSAKKATTFKKRRVTVEERSIEEMMEYIMNNLAKMDNIPRQEKTSIMGMFIALGYKAQKTIKEAEKIAMYYIKRNAVLALKQEVGAYGMDISSQEVEAISASDSINIIRCEECKWWTRTPDPLRGVCQLLKIHPPGSWYCANGKEKRRQNQI